MIALALTITAYVGGILLGWPGTAWVVCRMFNLDTSVEAATLDDNGRASVFRLFSLFSVLVQSVTSFATFLDHETSPFPFTGPLLLLVFFMPMITALWSYYSRKVDDYMGVE